MILTLTQNRLYQADLNRQLSLIRRSIRQLRRDFRRLKQDVLLENLLKLEAAIAFRQQSFATLMTLNANLGASVGAVDRTRALIKLSTSRGFGFGSAFNFLEAEAKIKREISNLDENRGLLGRIASYDQVQAAIDAGDQPLARKLEIESWLYAASFHALASLERQVESILNAQWALVHGQGLHFWQERQKWFRYAGDDLASSFDCISS